jgi:hypothetical protein
MHAPRPSRCTDVTFNVPAVKEEKDGSLLLEKKERGGLYVEVADLGNGSFELGGNFSKRPRKCKRKSVAVRATTPAKHSRRALKAALPAR